MAPSIPHIQCFAWLCVCVKASLSIPCVCLSYTHCESLLHCQKQEREDGERWERMKERGLCICI